MLFLPSFLVFDLSEKEIADVCRSDDDDSIAKMKAAEDALKVKDKVLWYLTVWWHGFNAKYVTYVCIFLVKSDLKSSQMIYALFEIIC